MKLPCSIGGCTRGASTLDGAMLLRGPWGVASMQTDTEREREGEDLVFIHLTWNLFIFLSFFELPFPTAHRAMCLRGLWIHPFQDAMKMERMVACKIILNIITFIKFHKLLPKVEVNSFFFFLIVIGKKNLFKKVHNLFFFFLPFFGEGRCCVWGTEC